MSYGSEQLFRQIDSDTVVASLISTYPGGNMIFVDPILPDAIVGPGDVTVNLYQAANFDHRLEYGEYAWTASCRGPSYSKARGLAVAVVNAVNRLSEEEYFFTAQSLPVLPPADGTDNYGVPVEITIKTRR